MYTPRNLALGLTFLIILSASALKAQLAFGYINTLSQPSKRVMPMPQKAGRQKEIQARIGFGVAAYATESSLTYDFLGTKITDRDTSGAATRHLNIDLRYEFHRRFNAGLDMKFGSYLYDPEENNEGKSNSYAVIGLGAEFNIVNKPAFRWYLGLGFNRGALSIREESTILNYKEEAIYSGGGFKMNSGILVYLGNSPFGFNFNIGYDKHTFNLDTYTQNGSSQDLRNIEGELIASGVDMTFGLVFRIRH
jgi:hypothetical protein